MQETLRRQAGALPPAFRQAAVPRRGFPNEDYNRAREAPAKQKEVLAQSEINRPLDECGHRGCQVSIHLAFPLAKCDRRLAEDAPAKVASSRTRYSYRNTSAGKIRVALRAG